MLDWDHRVPAFRHWRLRPMYELLQAVDVESLTGLICASDLIIGVDSGPLHLAGMTSTPRVGLFRDGHYPSTYLLPRGNPPLRDLSLVGTSRRDWNIIKRIPFGIVETDWTAKDIAEKSLALIDGKPYTPQIRDFLQQCRGVHASQFAEFTDRHKSFRAILDNAKVGTWVETGTIRQAEDWPGAGYSTYLFGAVLHACPEAKLYSVDLDPNHCEFARKSCAVFGNHVEVVNSRGEDFLRGFDGAIDLLYLDSCDTQHPEHAEVCLGELKAALPKLKPGAIVAVDDSPWGSGNFTGKGTLAVPFLLANGWEILFAGYQVVLRRKEHA
jgi:predicted O-methyltransferase YrrM